MKPMIRSHVFTFLLCLCFLCLMAKVTFPVYVANYSEHAYGGIAGCSSTLFHPAIPPIDPAVRDYVRSATVSLFNAQIEMTKALKGIETVANIEDRWDNMSSCVICQVTNDLHSATVHLRSAIDTYTLLCSYTDPVMNLHPVNPEMVYILKYFPYQTFFNSQYQWPEGPDTGMFTKIEDILSEGNVYEVYATLLSRSTALLNRLEEVKTILGYGYPQSVIKENFRKNEKIVIQKLWEAHYQELRVFLFGQYVSEIFFYIKNNYDLCLKREFYF